MCWNWHVTKLCTIPHLLWSKWGLKWNVIYILQLVTDILSGYQSRMVSACSSPLRSMQLSSKTVTRCPSTVSRTGTIRQEIRPVQSLITQSFVSAGSLYSNQDFSLLFSASSSLPEVSFQGHWLYLKSLLPPMLTCSLKKRHSAFHKAAKGKLTPSSQVKVTAGSLSATTCCWATAQMPLSYQLSAILSPPHHHHHNLQPSSLLLY